MLEQDLAELFEVQASEDQPPGHASVAAAAQHGRSRLRRRRLSIAAPLLAVVTVLALAIGGVLLTSAPTPPPQSQGQSHVVPRLYLWPGWLPRGMAITAGVLYNPHGETLDVGPAHGPFESSVSSFAAMCIAKQSKLSCNVQPDPSFDGFAGTVNAFPSIDGRAGTVNGYPAYWTGRGGLIVERSRDQWTVVTFPTRADDLRVARHLTAPVPPVRYPAQLTGNWPGTGLQYASFTYDHGRAVINGYALAQGAPLNPPGEAPPGQNTVQVDARPSGPKSKCGPPRGTAEVINGYHVVVSWVVRGGPDPIENVCATNADGLQVQTNSYGKHLVASAPAVFAHLKLFGPDPANWPATPFG
jgi:hypothetical protein